MTSWLVMLGAVAVGPVSPCCSPGHLTEPMPQDTSFSVSRGQRLEFRDFEGRVAVTAWGRDEVRIETGGRGDPSVRTRSSGGAVQVRPQRGGDDKGRYSVSVPAWMSVLIEGHELDVAVEGLRASLDVRTGEGDIEITDHEGAVSARSVEGVVVIERVTGDVSVSSGDDDVYVRDVRGRVEAQTIDGDVILDGITSSAVEGSTVDGDVRFSGPLDRNGQYRFVTHDGDVIVLLDAGVGATVSVSTFDADFESDFPVTMERFSAGQELRFTLGGGGARLQLEAFDGSIQLRRR